ncbi:MAG: hypothetical protein ACOZHQ_09525 [Thermodesulfobacteriota bacterium]
MVIDLNPAPPRTCAPGWCAFQCGLDSPVLSQGIALRSAPRLWLDGRLVATHVGTVITGDDGQLVVAEALPQGYALTPLAEWLDPGERHHARWFRRPRGLTLEAAEFISHLANLWAGCTGYDYRALAGFLLESDRRLAAGLRNRGENPDRLFCSEAASRLMQLADGVFSPHLPPSFMAAHASSITPHSLDAWPELWDPA